MPKKMRSLRLGERTWGQLERLQGWLQVENNTRVIEILVERESAIMSKSQNEQVLGNYEVGQRIEVEHPNGEQQEAVITAFTATDMGRLDGVMVKFADGHYIQIPAARLGTPEQNYVPYVDGSGQGW